MISVSENATDASMAINQAIHTAATVGGCEVVLGPGTFHIPASSQIIWPATANGVSLRGEGPAATKFTVDARVTDLFDLAQGNLNHVRLSGFGVTALDVCGGGSIIHAVNCYDLIIERIRLAGPFNDGITLNGGPNQYLATLRDIIIPGDPRSYRAIVLGEDALLQGVYIDTCKIAATQYGIWCANVSGLNLSDTEFLNHVNHGFVTYPMPGSIVEWLQIVGITADSCGKAGIYIGSGGGLVQGIAIGIGWSSSNDVGLELAPAPHCNRISYGLTQFLGNHTASILNHGATNVQDAGGNMKDKP